MILEKVIKLNDFIESVKGNKLPFKTSYNLIKLSKFIETETKFYQEKIQEIIQEFGAKDDDGKYIYTENGAGIKLIEGKEEECFTRIQELANIEVELPDINFDITEFKDVELTPEQIEAGMPLFE